MAISIAMCTYNGQRYLQNQLDSIANQTLPPSELVICDDGSTDGTEEIVREFVKRASFQVRFIRNDTNLGSTKNFEKAIRLSSGEFIALCDQDDEWLPQKLERLQAILQTDSRAGAVFSDAYLMDGSGGLIGVNLWSQVPYTPRHDKEYVRRDTLVRHNVVTGATMMLRSSLRGSFLPIVDSWIHDGWMAWMFVLRSNLVALREPLTKYRIHSSQQVGLPINSTLRSRLQRAREVGSKQQLLLARQFEELREEVIKDPEINSPDLVEDLDRKIRHSHFRASLPRVRIARMIPILLHAKDYRRCSLGGITMAKDLLR